MTNRNADLLKEVGERIAAEPASYSQATWGYAPQNSCNTTACVAGHALLASGYRLTQLQIFVDSNGKAIPDAAGVIRELAGNLLGLDANEAAILFDAEWEPRQDLGIDLAERVRKALYAIADGADIEDVTEGPTGWQED